MTEDIVKDMIEKCISSFEQVPICMKNLDSLLDKLPEDERMVYEERLMLAINTMSEFAISMQSELQQ